MKRLVCSLLCIFLCLGLFGCRKEEPTPILKPVQFFYLLKDFSYTSSGDVLGSELRESAGHEEDLGYLIDMYLQGPESPTLSDLFPDGCRFVSFSLESDVATLVVSDHFASLSGMDLTAACVCLAKTLTELTGHTTIVIQTETELLDGKNSITMEDGAFIFSDDYIAPTQSE